MTTESDPAYPAHWEADVVLRDGGTARIRPITTEDAARLVSFYEQVSDESKYYRFFAPYPRLSDRDVHRFTHHDYVDRVGLAATIGGEFIGTVRYDRIGADGRSATGPSDEAEVAFLVQDAHQGRGVASALLEHIGAVARERGIRRFAAEVLPANTKMIKVFTDAGYEQKRSFEDGSVHLTLGLEPTAESLAVQRAREQRAEARSVQRLLAPGSVAVIGVSRSGAGVGAAALRNLRDSGFRGHLYAVNEAVTRDLIDGVRAYRTVGAIGAPVDLAVIAVPADRVPEAVAACGDHGVQGLVVLSAGYGESGPAGLARQRELVRQVRSYGMRLIGPNAFGVINTAPEVELNASLTPAPMPMRGRIGLFTQSGAIGIALLSALLRRGEGLSSFVSAGNRADVSGNDILQYWYEDDSTDVALLYLETLGNPRKFTRLARRTAAEKPVVVVRGGRHTPAGHVVPGTRLPDATVSALLRQAGVIRVDTVTELVDVGLLLAAQPLPAGPRIAILGNSESLGVLTYDACLAQDLRPLPPLDLTTAASPADFRTALAAALASDDCDAVIVTAIPWVSEHAPADDLAGALRDAVAEVPGKPVAVVHVELGELVEALSAVRGAPRPSAPAPPREEPAAAPFRPPAGRARAEELPAGTRIPAYPAGERAVKAVAEAVRYGQWRRGLADSGSVPGYEDIDEAGAADQLAGLLADTAAETVLTLGEWEARELLGRYGIRVLTTLPAPSADAAVRAAAILGYPVALKTTAPHLRHRADLGGVRLDLTGEAELRRSYEELSQALGKPAELQPVVQAMVPRGVDTVVRSVIDPGAGAVLSFGLAGVPSELLGDTAHRLVPATDRDVATLIRSIRAAPLLFGWRGSSPVDTAALEELLLRLSRLVDDHPEVIGVSLEPVVVAAEGLSVLSAAVRVAHPPARGDLGPRTLPSY
ncbi:bifunctional acetate--CoA ligase family protein/GNAT family N-acetyltransferase [Streptomyces antarcticus]|uniref:bifunctional acetate--CoA ligase family protein/GNAT family N-acetyltransferase n=2 Tax=Streptomyces antarcticus TaxID=2996458 RepID=UPI0022709175|nr:MULTISPECIES: bifunctional GNAT family N-acetyltransferase/acetate--CoA ligase family protein [unclassified Streptomyces]MCY0944228.1 GNAT family N-acetyltransferase [Streptomyces sp. H34-AA3]MCY0953409.1 GNAT family N-acetyltransferase [Streptomyces sp. H27-S2]